MLKSWTVPGMIHHITLPVLSHVSEFRCSWEKILDVAQHIHWDGLLLLRLAVMFCLDVRGADCNAAQLPAGRTVLWTVHTPLLTNLIWEQKVYAKLKSMFNRVRGQGGVKPRFPDADIHMKHQVLILLFPGVQNEDRWGHQLISITNGSSSNDDAYILTWDWNNLRREIKDTPWRIDESKRRTAADPHWSLHHLCHLPQPPGDGISQSELRRTGSLHVSFPSSPPVSRGEGGQVEDRFEWNSWKAITEYTSTNINFWS